MRRHPSTSDAPGSLMGRVLVFLAAVQIVVILLPASAAGQEEPVAPVGGTTTQEAEQAEPPPPEPDPTPTETTPTETTPTETTPTATTPTETTPTETTPTETTPTETSTTPTKEPSSSVCASQGTESVETDQSEYAPGSTAHITGTGFATSCEGIIDITPTEGGSAPVVIEAETSPDGQLVGDYHVDGTPGTYDVRVVGLDDAVLGSTTFSVRAEESGPAECAAGGTESVVTDKSEYAPGSTVHITGDGYTTSCDLRVEMTRPDGSAATADAQVAAATGAFQYDFALGDLTGRYEVRVLSAAGEALASTTFVVKEAGPTSCERRGTESIATDKADYAPGETVHMAGAGYAPSCLVKIKVVRPDGSVVKGDGSFTPGVDQVRTAARGTLAYDYILNGIEGLYRVSVLGAGNAVLATTTFTDQIRATPSDPRATFVPRNLIQCLQVGFPADVQLGAHDSDAAGDNFVVGTPTGSDPDRLQVEITPAGVAAGVGVDAVVVKGSNGSNVYTAPFVPPGEAAPQNYISPRTEGGPIANISHWFVCYSFGGIEPGQGSLLVLKRVVPPPGPPVEPLPTEFTVEVICTNSEGEEVVNETITFGPGGGVGTVIGGGVVRSGIPVGSVCTVVEQGTDTFPDGTVVTYIPAGAPTEGVVIDEGAGVVVGVVNDFSNVEVQTGSLQVNKVLIPPPAGVDLPDSFIVHVACSDGTLTDVTVPAGGSATVDDITADATCVVRERIGSLPPELEVTYSPSPFPQQLAIVQIGANETVEVTVTNDASNIPVTPPAPPPPPPGPPPGPPTGPPGGGPPGEPSIDVSFQQPGQATQPTGELPFTGAPAGLVGAVGLALIAGGLALVRRRKD
jgi:hypothetical protein